MFYFGLCRSPLFCLVLDIVVSVAFLFEKTTLLLWFLYVWAVLYHIDISEFRLLWWSQFDSVVLQWLECAVVLQCF